MFSGTEHFRYSVSTGTGEPQTGFYDIDATPAGSGVVQLVVKGQVGDRNYSTVAMFAPNQPLPMAALAQLGPAVILFTGGSMFMNRPMQLGEEQSNVSAGRSMTTKVESTCQYAGVQGLRGVMRTDQVVTELCVSPNVALPVALTMAYGSGSTAFSYGLKLTQFRP